MKQSRLVTCCALLLVHAATLTATADVVVTQTRLGPYEQLHLRSPQLDLGFVPAMGGRVMTMKFTGDEFNFLRVVPPWMVEMQRDEIYGYYYGLNKGGMRGVHMPTWPGMRLNNVAYDTRIVNDADGVPTLIATATADGVRDQRTLRIVPGTTTCYIGTTLTNQRSQFSDMMIRLNGEYTVGAEGATTYFPDGRGNIQRIPYVLGREEGRGLRPSRGDWLAKLDHARGLLMLIRYPADEVDRVLLWTGAGGWANVLEYHPVPDDYHGFVGYNLFQKVREVQPGGGVEMVQEHSLYRGLSDLDLVAGRVVMQMIPPVVPVGTHDPVILRLMIAAPTARVVRDIHAGIASPNTEIPIAEQALEATTTRPGVAAVETLRFDPPEAGWPTAELELRVRYEGEAFSRSIVLRGTGP